MYEQFTDEAIEAMRAANQEAEKTKCDYIGTRHILLGLIARKKCAAYRVMERLGIDFSTLNKKIRENPPESPAIQLPEKLPQTPRAKKVIEYAMEESRALCHNYLGTEHLLLGILRETAGEGFKVLTNFGLTVDGVRQEVKNFLAGASPLPIEPKEDFQPPVKTRYKGIEVKKENGTSFGQFIDSLNRADTDGWQEIVMINANGISFLAILRRPD